MRVEVRPLCADGVLMSTERIGAARVHRGELRVLRRVDAWRARRVAVATLVAEDRVTRLLPPLDDVRIARWEGCDLVLVGFEAQVSRAGGDELDERARPRRQSWWVKLVDQLQEVGEPLDV